MTPMWVTAAQVSGPSPAASSSSHARTRARTCAGDSPPSGVVSHPPAPTAARARPVHSPQSCSASRGSTQGATAPRIRAVSTGPPQRADGPAELTARREAAEVRGQPPARRARRPVGRERRVRLTEHAPLGVPRRRGVTDQRDVDRAHGRPRSASPAARRSSKAARVRSVAMKRRAAAPIVLRRAGSSSSRATPRREGIGRGRGEERPARRDHRDQARAPRTPRRASPPRRPAGRRRGSVRGTRRGPRREYAVGRISGSRAPRTRRGRTARRRGARPRPVARGHRRPRRAASGRARVRGREGIRRGSGTARASSPRAWRRPPGSRGPRAPLKRRAIAARQAGGFSALASKRAASTAGGRSRIRSAAKRRPAVRGDARRGPAGSSGR